VKIPKSDAARLKLARKLFARYASWHRHVPDEPIYLDNTEAAFVQRVREFLRATEEKPC